VRIDDLHMPPSALEPFEPAAFERTQESKDACAYWPTGDSEADSDESMDDLSTQTNHAAELSPRAPVVVNEAQMHAARRRVKWEDLGCSLCDKDPDVQKEHNKLVLIGPFAPDDRVRVTCMKRKHAVLIEPCQWFVTEALARVSECKICQQPERIQFARDVQTCVECSSRMRLPDHTTVSLVACYDFLLDAGFHDATVVLHEQRHVAGDTLAQQIPNPNRQRNDHQYAAERTDRRVRDRERVQTLSPRSPEARHQSSRRKAQRRDREFADAPRPVTRKHTSPRRSERLRDAPSEYANAQGNKRGRLLVDRDDRQTKKHYSAYGSDKRGGNADASRLAPVAARNDDGKKQATRLDLADKPRPLDETQSSVQAVPSKMRKFVPARGFSGLPRVCTQSEAVAAMRFACVSSVKHPDGTNRVDGGGYDLCTALRRLDVSKPTGGADGFLRIQYAGSDHTVYMHACDMPPLINYGIGEH
jgi:hypothetical protein